jgi:hypothetical membrane protein
VSANRRRLLRLVACFCLLAPPLSAGAVLAASLSSPTYHPLSRSLSVLGEHGAPMSVAVNASFGALGISVLALGLAVDRVVAQAGRGGRGGVRLLVVAGLSLVGVAVIARDPTSPGLLALHRLLALVAFVSLAAAPLLLVSRLAADLDWRAHARPSLAFGVAGVVLLAAGALLVGGGRLRAGAWETIFASLTLAWLMLTATRLALATWRQV